MRLGDTIAAISTGAGAGHRCMIRVSGPGTREVLRSLAISPMGEEAQPGILPLRLAPFASEPGLGMPSIAYVFNAPRSYTGEDAAELLIPGGPALRRILLDRVLAIEGVRPAEPGEFSARAYLIGKLTPEQAEGVAAVIAARNAGELGAARELLDGTTGAVYRSIADDLASALALVEAGIDFTDQEDVVTISSNELTERLGLISDSLRRIVGDRSPAIAADQPEPLVVLVGAPNAGKSTLFNALLGRLRAVVSDRPGTTRDAIEERLSLEGVGPGAVRLVDLAGLDEAVARRSHLDELGQRRARETIARADVLVLCAPWGTPWPGVTASGEQRLLRVRTKADLTHAPAPAPPVDETPVCALDGRGVGVVRQNISDAALSVASRASEADPLVPRHRACLSRALAGVQSAMARVGLQPASASIAEPELVAGDLREALDQVGQVAGRISPDDVIGRIFTAFCIGK